MSKKWLYLPCAALVLSVGLTPAFADRDHDKDHGHGNGNGQPQLTLLVSAKHCYLIIMLGEDSGRFSRKAITSCEPCRRPLYLRSSRVPRKRVS